MENINDELMFPNLYYNYTFKNYKRVLKEVDDQDNIENDIQKIFNDKSRIYIEPYEVYIKYIKDKKEYNKRKGGIFRIYYFFKDFYGSITIYGIINTMINMLFWASISILIHHNSNRIDRFFEIIKNNMYAFLKYIRIIK